MLVDRDDRIAAGYDRVEAAKSLKFERSSNDMSGESLAKTAASLCHRRRQAGWDNSLLAIELQELLTLDLDFDVTITGFEVPEIDLILQQAEATSDLADQFETPMGSAISCLRDAWLLGKHRVFCGTLWMSRPTQTSKRPSPRK